jgi:hypothetical protein
MMKDNLNLNNLWDPSQISNLSLDEQTILYKSIKCRRPPMEDKLKILKVEYLSNHGTVHDFGGESAGKLRGNLKCCSAQPSLFHPYFVNNSLIRAIKFIKDNYLS